MLLPEDFPDCLRGHGFHYITDGIWSKVTGGGTVYLVYSGNGKWIVQEKTTMLTGLTAKQVYEYIKGTIHKKPRD